MKIFLFLVLAISSSCNSRNYKKEVNFPVNEQKYHLDGKRSGNHEGIRSPIIIHLTESEKVALIPPVTIERLQNLINVRMVICNTVYIVHPDFAFSLPFYAIQDSDFAGNCTDIYLFIPKEVSLRLENILPRLDGQ